MKLSLKGKTKLDLKTIKKLKNHTFHCEKPIKTITGLSLSMLIVIARAVQLETKSFNKRINYLSSRLLKWTH